ncbi:hypothetical protein AC1031_021524 [Aphanomyces cochlioides]|nr:hypothetical protein AC1031_021524 [Aphanomyces cochlioides]
MSESHFPCTQEGLAFSSTSASSSSFRFVPPSLYSLLLTCVDGQMNQTNQTNLDNGTIILLAFCPSKTLQTTPNDVCLHDQRGQATAIRQANSSQLTLAGLNLRRFNDCHLKQLPCTKATRFLFFRFVLECNPVFELIDLWRRDIVRRRFGLLFGLRDAIETSNAIQSQAY